MIVFGINSVQSDHVSNLYKHNLFFFYPVFNTLQRITFLCKLKPWVNTKPFPVESVLVFIRVEALEETFALNSLTQMQ